jgi:hypothetical protein
VCASRRKRVVGGGAAAVVGAQEGHLVRLAQLGHVRGAGEPRGAQRHRLSVHRSGVRQVSEVILRLSDSSRCQDLRFTPTHTSHSAFTRRWGVEKAE